PEPATRLQEPNDQVALFGRQLCTHGRDYVHRSVLMQPPNGREPFDDNQVVDRRTDTVRVVQEEMLVEPQNRTLALSFRGENVSREIWRDGRGIHRSPSISHEFA